MFSTDHMEIPKEPTSVSASGWNNDVRANPLTIPTDVLVNPN